MKLVEEKFGNEYTRGIKAAKAVVAQNPSDIVARCLLVRALYVAHSEFAANEQLNVLRELVKNSSELTVEYQCAIREVETLGKWANEPLIDEGPREKEVLAMSPEEFENSLDTIRWMDNLGSPNDRDAFVDRISEWDSWDGPESAGSDRFNDLSMKWQDEILKLIEGRRLEEAEHFASRIAEKVFEAVKKTVPYDPELDVWHGPNAAPELAAFCARTIAYYVFANEPIPPLLRDEWQWYVEGHWPCGCAFYPDDENDDDDDDVLVVY